MTPPEPAPGPAADDRPSGEPAGPAGPPPEGGPHGSGDGQPAEGRSEAADRRRGLTLYALSLVLAAAGAGWFFGSAPNTGEDPRTVEGRRALARAVPDLSEQAQAETLVIAAGSRAERNAPVRRGAYVLVVACTGAGQMRVRLSTTTVDSGRAVPCAEQPAPVQLSVALSSMFFLSVASEADRENVFRWRLVRSGSL